MQKLLNNCQKAATDYWPKGKRQKNGKVLIFVINRHRAWQIIKECAERAGLEKLLNPDTGKWHNVSPHRLRDAFSVMATQRDGSTDGVRMLQQQPDIGGCLAMSIAVGITGCGQITLNS
jgi:integrase